MSSTFNLLDDFTIQYIFQFFSRNQEAISYLCANLRATCRRFSKLIKAPKKIRANNLLFLGAQSNSRELCELARSWGARDFSRMLWRATDINSRELIDLAQQWIQEQSAHSSS